MNEFLVLFHTLDNVERAGLSEAYVTRINSVFVVRLRMYTLPWNLIRECVSYATLSRVSFQLRMVNSDRHEINEVHKLTQAALNENIPTINISL
jgi:hypothetical protein